ncbi:MAG TPA: hypothetical protein VKV39_02340 [Candidatus Sulfotelmatobacter sp.]|nr:hypothetical protein [Candidatus Sulfotelmatobacter sp.]
MSRLPSVKFTEAKYSLRRRAASRKGLRFPQLQGAVLSFSFVILLLASLSSAFAQDFTLQASPFQPYAMDPGGTALSTLTLSPVNGFNGSVTLACAVTPATSTSPGCIVSPTDVTPSATASLTVTGTNPVSGSSALPGSYTVTVTGTGYNGTTHQQAPAISVLSVAPGYTITIQSGVVPSSVHAGSGGQAVINVNPLNGYTTSGTSTSDGVWLTCSTITPLVTIPPVCSFNPQPVQVLGGVVSSTLTISTSAPPVTRLQRPVGWFYAVWLPLPLLGLIGVGAARNRRARSAWGLMTLLLLAGSMLLIPACGSSNSFTTDTTTNVTTPKNTYTFTITGVDNAGVVSTNTSSTTAGPTVTLTVN